MWKTIKRWPIIRTFRALGMAIKYSWVIVLWEPQKPPGHFRRLREIERVAKGKDSPNDE